MVSIVSEHRNFGGVTRVCEHESTATGTRMRFGMFEPDRPDPAGPVLYYLAGLTCTEETFLIKSGAQRLASALGVTLVAPDTSPRGDQVADAPDGGYDLGLGASFYLDATEFPWRPNYRMYQYVVQELPALLAGHFDLSLQRQGIFGHSMGGHGALTIALKNPDQYRSVSAFAPICAPSKSPWGEKAFTAYLGKDRSKWRQYDATALIEDGASWPADREILLDQGSMDEFLESQLHPHLLQQACKSAGINLRWREHTQFDHGYYFISTFMEDHIRHHARYLCDGGKLSRDS